MVFIISTISTSLIAFQLKRYRFFPLVSFLYVFFITIQNDTCTYYLSSCAIFMLFGFVAVITPLSYHHRAVVSKYSIAASAVAGLLCIYTNYEIHDKTGNYFFQDNEKRASYYRFAGIMSEVGNPRIVYLGFLNGYGVPVNSLPGCKYFGRQDGELACMKEEAKDACRKHRPDFVVVYTDSLPYRRFVETCGYHACDSTTAEPRAVLYSKRKTAKRPLPHISNSDVLSKRKISFTER